MRDIDPQTWDAAAGAGAQHERSRCARHRPPRARTPTTTRHGQRDRWPRHPLSGGATGARSHGCSRWSNGRDFGLSQRSPSVLRRSHASGEASVSAASAETSDCRPERASDHARRRRPLRGGRSSAPVDRPHARAPLSCSMPGSGAVAVVPRGAEARLLRLYGRATRPVTVAPCARGSSARVSAWIPPARYCGGVVLGAGRSLCADSAAPQECAAAAIRGSARGLPDRIRHRAGLAALLDGERALHAGLAVPGD